MPAWFPVARLLRLMPCLALLQGCAAVFGSKSTNVAAVADTTNAAVVAAEAQRDTATAALPPIQPFQASAPNEIVSERVQAERRRAVGDMLRTGLITTVEQGRPGILRVGVGEKFHSHQAREYYFTQLEVAYHNWATDSHPLVIELWESGRKIGEYTNRAFRIGPDHTTPLDCPEAATTGLCSSLGESVQREIPPVAPARGQPAPIAARTGSPVKGRQRSGFHFGLGLGGGAMDFACHGCEFASETGFSGFLSVAGSLGEKTLVGVEATGWAKDRSGTTAQVYSLTANATEYRSATSGLFLSAGVGVVGYREGDLSARAFGFSGRLGYELGTRGIALVPYLGIVRTFGGAEMKLDGEDAGLNVAISNVQFGLSIAAH